MCRHAKYDTLYMRFIEIKAIKTNDRFRWSAFLIYIIVDIKYITVTLATGFTSTRFPGEATDFDRRHSPGGRIDQTSG